VRAPRSVSAHGPGASEKQIVLVTVTLSSVAAFRTWVARRSGRFQIDGRVSGTTTFSTGLLWYTKTTLCDPVPVGTIR